MLSPGEAGNASVSSGEASSRIVAPSPVLIKGNLSKIEPGYQEFYPLWDIPGVINYKANAT
jgi:hypothetical protein